MTIAWVLGSGGLLGAALCRALRQKRTELFFPVQPLCWNDGPTLVSQISANVNAFSSRFGRADRWEIYWAAGIGNMSSSEVALAHETRHLSLVLRLVQSDPRLAAASGTIVFSSSAGAINAGSAVELITENTPPAPTTAYAHEKLRQEDLLRSFAIANDRVSILIARISTLYGPGQAIGKQQGLLAHMARSILRNQPIQIYVPYDTIRDYIAADDAAAAMVTVSGAISAKPRVLTKIVASENPTTIAEIISIFKRITRRAPRIVTSSSRLSALYARRVQFRSVALPEGGKVQNRSLLVGITQLMMAERAAFVSGREARIV